MIKVRIVALQCFAQSSGADQYDSERITPIYAFGNNESVGRFARWGAEKPGFCEVEDASAAGRRNSRRMRLIASSNSAFLFKRDARARLANSPTFICPIVPSYVAAP
jgi:hypothetical protein